MIRILQIVDNIAPDRGVASVVMNLYRHMDNTKVQFDFLVCTKTEDSYEKEIYERGGKVFYVGNPLSIRSLTDSCNNITAFFRNHYNEYKIAHLHSPTIALFTLPLAKKSGITQRIVHSHSSMTSTNKIKAVINIFLMIAARKCSNHYWACSDEAAFFLFGKKCCKNGKYELIMNAVDPDRFYYDFPRRTVYRKKLGCENKKVVVHVSNFTKVKNVDFLVPIIKRITCKYNDFCFLFIGDGPEMSGLRDLLCDNKSVIFTGRVINVSDYLQAADLMLLPSLREGLPVSVVEAQACGLKCLVTDTITRGADVGGITYAPLDAAIWEKKIIELSQNSMNSREKLAQQYEKSSFNLKHEAKRVQDLYLTMCQ